jgi:hypothetical protein
MVACSGIMAAQRYIEHLYRNVVVVVDGHAVWYGSVFCVSVCEPFGLHKQAA